MLADFHTVSNNMAPVLAVHLLLALHIDLRHYCEHLDERFGCTESCLLQVLCNAMSILCEGLENSCVLCALS